MFCCCQLLEKSSVLCWVQLQKFKTFDCDWSKSYNLKSIRTCLTEKSSYETSIKNYKSSLWQKSLHQWCHNKGAELHITAKCQRNMHYKKFFFDLAASSTSYVLVSVIVYLFSSDEFSLSSLLWLDLGSVRSAGNVTAIYDKLPLPVNK